MSKIGLGIVTCDRPDFLSKCIEGIDLDLFHRRVIVNDGKMPVKHNRFNIINNEENLGVGKSKNKILQDLYNNDCDYIFLLEDDMIVHDNIVFQKYIDASKRSGIQHFNYGPGSPFNRKQNVAFDLHNRHELDQHSDPVPRKIIDYGNNVKVSLFTHTVAMFSFFTRKCIEECGYLDEDFYNAWEHVDHTYRIAKAGLHPPFWWFADIADSHHLISEAPQAIDKSSIAENKEQWEKNVFGGIEIYKKKHGHVPNQPPLVNESEIPSILKEIKNKYATR